MKYYLSNILKPSNFIIIILCLFVSINLFAMSDMAEVSKNLPTIDKVEVFKSKRLLNLLTEKTQGEYEIVRSYSISLGGNPIGHKEEQGDKRTPEGLYVLDWKNPNSSFHLSIHVSYPNKEDQRRAEERGVDPGGEIFIHGIPNRMKKIAKTLFPFSPTKAEEFIHTLFFQRDWTLGCIAVSNREIEEIFELIKTPVDIEIFP